MNFETRRSAFTQYEKNRRKRKDTYADPIGVKTKQQQYGSSNLSLQFDAEMNPKFQSCSTPFNSIQHVHSAPLLYNDVGSHNNAGDRKLPSCSPQGSYSSRLCQLPSKNRPQPSPSPAVAFRSLSCSSASTTFQPSLTHLNVDFTRRSGLGEPDFCNPSWSSPQPSFKQKFECMDNRELLSPNNQHYNAPQHTSNRSSESAKKFTDSPKQQRSVPPTWYTDNESAADRGDVLIKTFAKCKELVGVVVKDIARLVLGSIPGPVKSNTASPTVAMFLPNSVAQALRRDSLHWLHAWT